MASHVHPIVHHHVKSTHVRVMGPPISDSSMHLLRQLASEAHLHTVHITSVHRSVADQARIFYDKHVVEGKAARYKNPAVKEIVAHARKLRKEGHPADNIKAYLIDAIEHIHGGPTSVSAHIGVHIFTEIFDVAHYSGPTAAATRQNSMTDLQARSFLAACRKRMPSTIARLGHSSELGFLLPTEFHDEKCFHFEVKQLLYDKLEETPTTMIA
jgi:hypothetical protein